MTEPIIMVLNNALYPRKAVDEARISFLEHCEVRASPVSKNSVELSFFVKERYREQVREVVLEFLNYALDRSVQLQLEGTE